MQTLKVNGAEFKSAVERVAKLVPKKVGMEENPLYKVINLRLDDGRLYISGGDSQNTLIVDIEVVETDYEFFEVLVEPGSILKGFINFTDVLTLVKSEKLFSITDTVGDTVINQVGDPTLFPSVKFTSQNGIAYLGSDLLNYPAKVIAPIASEVSLQTYTGGLVLCAGDDDRIAFSERGLSSREPPANDTELFSKHF